MWNFLAGLRDGRLVAPFVLGGSINDASFTIWIEQCLALIVPSLSYRLAVEEKGRSARHLTVGETVDCKAYDILINLPEQVPQALLADKGYDADVIRDDLSGRNIEPGIPGRSNRGVKIEYDRTLYKRTT